jgi:poly(3-hydroxybutyrate) depolymerase
VGDGDTKSNGLWDTGYLYVPAACEAASGHCRLHVALHGCRQSAQKLHDTFYRHIGVNEWADITTSLCSTRRRARLRSETSRIRSRPTS